MKKMRDWYINNIGKLLLLFIVIVIISLTAVYIPYLSFILSPGIRLFIILLCFYLLFPLSTNKLVFISVIAIILAFVFTFLEMRLMADPLGDLLYLILVFIFVNYLKSIKKQKIDF